MQDVERIFRTNDGKDCFNDEEECDPRIREVEWSGGQEEYDDPDLCTLVLDNVLLPALDEVYCTDIFEISHQPVAFDFIVWRPKKSSLSAFHATGNVPLWRDCWENLRMSELSETEMERRLKEEMECYFNEENASVCTDDGPHSSDGVLGYYEKRSRRAALDFSSAFLNDKSTGHTAIEGATQSENVTESFSQDSTRDVSSSQLLVPHIETDAVNLTDGGQYVWNHSGTDEETQMDVPANEYSDLSRLDYYQYDPEEYFSHSLPSLDDEFRNSEEEDYASNTEQYSLEQDAHPLLDRILKSKLHSDESESSQDVSIADVDSESCSIASKALPYSLFEEIEQFDYRLLCDNFLTKLLNCQEVDELKKLLHPFFETDCTDQDDANPAENFRKKSYMNFLFVIVKYLVSESVKPIRLYSLFPTDDEENYPFPIQLPERLAVRQLGSFDGYLPQNYSSDLHFYVCNCESGFIQPVLESEHATETYQMAESIILETISGVCAEADVFDTDLRVEDVSTAEWNYPCHKVLPTYDEEWVNPSQPCDTQGISKEPAMPGSFMDSMNSRGNFEAEFPVLGFGNDTATTSNEETGVTQIPKDKKFSLRGSINSANYNSFLKSNFFDQSEEACSFPQELETTSPISTNCFHDSFDKLPYNKVIQKNSPPVTYSYSKSPSISESLDGKEVFHDDVKISNILKLTDKTSDIASSNSKNSNDLGAFPSGKTKPLLLDVRTGGNISSTKFTDGATSYSRDRISGISDYSGFINFKKITKRSKSNISKKKKLQRKGSRCLSLDIDQLQCSVLGSSATHLRTSTDFEPIKKTDDEISLENVTSVSNSNQIRSDSKKVSLKNLSPVSTKFGIISKAPEIKYRTVLEEMNISMEEMKSMIANFAEPRFFKLSRSLIYYALRNPEEMPTLTNYDSTDSYRGEEEVRFRWMNSHSTKFSPVIQKYCISEQKRNLGTKKLVISNHSISFTATVGDNICEKTVFAKISNAPNIQQSQHIESISSEKWQDIERKKEKIIVFCQNGVALPNCIVASNLHPALVGVGCVDIFRLLKALTPISERKRFR